MINRKMTKKGDRLEDTAMTPGADALIVYTDGASRGNPGDAAWAYVIVRGGSVVAWRSGYLGKTTNNVAEYHAIINALRAARELTSGSVLVRSDSELVVRQVTGRYRIRKEHLAGLAEEVRRLIQKYVEVYVDCPTDELIKRDSTGKYKKALAGEIPNFVGITEPYEPPGTPEVTIHTNLEELEAAAVAPRPARRRRRR